VRAPINNAATPQSSLSASAPTATSSFAVGHRLPETHNCAQQEQLRSAAFAANKEKLESERTVGTRGLVH